jgi:Leucine-rich repeat (LRR) protein
VSLRHLTLNGVPPSTVLDLYVARHFLYQLEITNAGIPSLFHVLAPIKRKYICRLPPMILSGQSPVIKSKYLWTELKILKMTNCGIAKLDGSLQMTNRLEQLDISNNDISQIIYLQNCLNLRVLNASNNRLNVLSNLCWVIGSIQRLNLSYNAIESLDGIEKLAQLERIDLSYNKITDLSEVQSLSTLKHLTHVYLSGNTICLHPNYRLHVFSQLLQDCAVDGRPLPLLDGRALSPTESHTIRYVYTISG